MGDIIANTNFELLKKGDDSALQKVYVENRDVFLSFSRKFNISSDDAEDIYHDTIIAFRENLVTGHLKELKSSLSTYLFAIGKNMIYQLQRQNSRRMNHYIYTIYEKNGIPDVNLSEEKATKQQKLLEKVLEKIGKRCKEILNLSFIEGYTIKEVREILNYSSINVLKSQKSRCLKRIRELAKQLI
jgi:RNA polymerase sigma factor (sigma-70 family)